MLDDAAAGAARRQHGGIAVEAGVAAECACGDEGADDERHLRPHRVRQRQHDGDGDREDAPERRRGEGDEGHREEGDGREQPWRHQGFDRLDEVYGEPESVVHLLEEEAAEYRGEGDDHREDPRHCGVERGAHAEEPGARDDGEGDAERDDDPLQNVEVEDPRGGHERDDRDDEVPRARPLGRGRIRLALELRLIEARRGDLPRLQGPALRLPHGADGGDEAGADEEGQRHRDPGVEHERDRIDVEREAAARRRPPRLLEQA